MNARKTVVESLIESAEAVLSLLEGEGRDTGAGGPLSDLRDVVTRAKEALESNPLIRSLRESIDKTSGGQRAHAAAVDADNTGELHDPALGKNQVWKKLFAGTLPCDMPDGTTELLVRWALLHPTLPQVGLFACEASSGSPLAPCFTAEELAGILSQIEDIQLKRNEKFLRSEKERRAAHRTRALDRINSLRAKGG